MFFHFYVDIYFSGYEEERKILYKAELIFISYHLERIPRLNLIGSTHVSIVSYEVRLPE